MKSPFSFLSYLPWKLLWVAQTLGNSVTAAVTPNLKHASLDHACKAAAIHLLVTSPAMHVACSSVQLLFSGSM